MREHYSLIATEPPWCEDYEIPSLNSPTFMALAIGAGIPNALPISLSVGKRMLMERQCAQWGILAHWLAAMRSGQYNPLEEPYTTDEFLGLESFAELLNAEFELCRGVFKFSRQLYFGQKALDTYSSVYHFWASCLCEYRNWAYNVIANDDASPIGKRKIVSGYRNIRTQLKQGKNPFPNEPYYIHHHKLIQVSLCLRRNLSGKDYKTFVRKHWSPFIDEWTAYIRSIHEGDGKEVFAGENYLYSIEKDNYKRRVKMKTPESFTG